MFLLCVLCVLCGEIGSAHWDLDPAGIRHGERLMKAVVLEAFGSPGQVLQVRDVPTPEPGPGEVLVRMIASPINPSDLMLTEGRYVFRPALPATPGFEGVGVVEKAGPGLYGRFLVGRRVAVLNGKGGNWAEFAVIPAVQAIPVGSRLPDEQVASFFVNPATALAMVRDVLKIPRGEWLLQSAAGSALGKMIIKLGRHDGFKTLNVVRRSEAKAELQALGVDAVISTSEGPIPDQVRQIVGKDGIGFAIDPVGGETGTGVFQSLRVGASMLVFGSLSQEPIALDPRRMITTGIRVEGFWLGHWMRRRSKLASVRLFQAIGKLIREGVLDTEPGPSFSLDAIAEATSQAASMGKSGKVLLRIRPD